MIKLIIPIVLAFLIFDCGKKQPPPRPTPTPTPVVVPTPEPTPTLVPTPEPTATVTPEPSPSAFPTPTVKPTPYPTPQIDPASYIAPDEAGPTITVSLDAVVVHGARRARGAKLIAKRKQAVGRGDIGFLINAANAELTRLGGGKLEIKGGGAIITQVNLDHTFSFDGSTYSCETELTDSGCMLVGDGVHGSGTWVAPQALLDYFARGNGANPDDPYLKAVQALTPEELAGIGTTILEQTYHDNFPALIVFQAKGDSCCSHGETSHNIALTGFHIKGRQQQYDGGVRSTVQFGNCISCMAKDFYLEDTAGIGIEFGGVALDTGNFADDDLVYHNVLSGVAAANIAGVNSENLYVMENYVLRPGHHDPLFGGGVCGFDLETNTGADHSKNIWTVNNLIDFEGANRDGAGNGICLQDPYVGRNHGTVTAVNNVVLGGRDDALHRYMSNGLFVNQLKGCQIVNNYVFKTGQNAMQAYGLDGCLVQDNEFDSTGGGGNPTIWSQGVINTVFRRNAFSLRTIGFSTDSSWLELCGRDNVYENNWRTGPTKGCL